MKLPFSKWIVIYVFVLVTAFIIWCCYEMHRLCDLSPVSFIGGGIIGMLATVVAAYMWRAKQSDLYSLEIAKTKILGKKDHPVSGVDDISMEDDSYEGIEDEAYVP